MAAAAYQPQYSFHNQEEEKKEPNIKEYSVIPREERKYGAYTQLRPGFADEYEPAMSGREGWWRKTIKETPLPGAYEVPEKDTFLLELEKKKNSYRFKNEGRTTDPQRFIGKGEYLMPGAYKYDDFAKLTAKNNQNTYGFKDTSRDARDVMNFGRKDKDVNVPPGQYEVHEYETLSCDKMPSKHSVFKSQTSRFPTLQFKPKTGPSPGNYEYTPPRPLFTVSSSFKSKTPRFATSHSKYPGPGAYVPCFQYPLPHTVADMGRKHGLFFSSAFKG